MILECNCFAIGTKKNTACDAINGKCSCKVGYVGDKCDTCDNGYFKLLNGVCEGMLNSKTSLQAFKNLSYRM